MSDVFFNTSKTIANDFLQSIVFIDDRAFFDEKEANEHEFSAVDITRAFANSQKVCAVYRPETLQDINNLALLAKKADVTVLDWRIEITEEDVADENGEEDAEDIDPRGTHTLKIIREILSDPLTGKGSLKLILIYTGETNLPGITDTIHENLQEQNIENVEKRDCTVFTENIRIIVLAKQTGGEDQYKHNPELKNKIVSYEALPDYILTQFTDMTSGLLTNFVLQSLTAIRANTFRLIKLYEKELDAPFVMHRILLPNPEDAEEQLIETLTLSIEALLNYQKTADVVSHDRVFDWLDTRILANKKISIRGKDLVVDTAFIKDWEDNGFVEACKKKWIASNFGDVSKKLINEFEDKERKELHKEGSVYLREENEPSDIDSKFSILTHHRSNLKQPSSAPRLTLGTLIKQEHSGDDKGQKERYYLCIQARCDSVRVDALRKFLFLPLEKVESHSKFHFVVEENEFTKLRIVKEAFELRTIKFNPNAKHQVVLANESNGKYFFESNHGERFQWLADLKEAHAQREVNNFAAKISRVGLDESEWLRRWAT
ncbi:MAG: response regulator receiver domain [Bacteroidia bacterium]